MNIFTEDNQNLAPEIESVIKTISWRFYREGIDVGYTFDDYCQEGRAFAVSIRESLESRDDRAAVNYFARAFHNHIMTRVVRYARKKIRRPRVFAVGDDEWNPPDPTDRIAESDARLDLQTMRAFIEKELQFREPGQRAPEMRRKVVRETLTGWKPSEVAIILQTTCRAVRTHLWDFVQLARKHAVEAGLA